ncbi:MAG: NADH-quinone oxidoreductase subunit NuoK [Syntrophales bacterium]|nr:NADH-quinone oxidoreductase subunit NuoK [Syntrophales bacterium]
MTVWNLSSFLEPYLIMAVALFIIGFFGFLYHRTLIGMLISGELILAAASLNLVAFSRFLSPNPVTGQVFTLFIMGLAAAEACIVLALIIAMYRNYQSVHTETIDELRG